MYQDTAHFYDFFDSGPEESIRRSSFYSSFLNPNSNVIIDIGAGTGEVAFLLAEAGQRVFCFKPSVSMYSILLDRLNKRVDLHNNISVFPSKLEELEYSIQADVAFASSVFSHLSIEQRGALLAGLMRHLKPGGKLIFDCVQFVQARPNKPLSQIAEKLVGEITYRHLSSSEQISPQIRKVTWRFATEYKSQKLNEYNEDYFLNMDTKSSIQDFLETSGFKLLDVFGGYDRSPAEGNKPSLVVVAEKGLS